jgi:hypothetical protein
MNTTDLAEKLKELLMECENREGGYYFYGGDANLLAKQLAPEIEKLLPRWIPVSERLPKIGRVVDVWVPGEGRLAAVEKKIDAIGKGYFSNHDYVTWNATHWMPIPKGPTE